MWNVPPTRSTPRQVEEPVAPPAVHGRPAEVTVDDPHRPAPLRRRACRAGTRPTGSRPTWTPTCTSPYDANVRPGRSVPRITCDADPRVPRRRGVAKSGQVSPSPPSRRPGDETDAMTRRIRIGIDTGGTFTDVVAFDEDTGELVTTKTPSTPSNPADGFMAGIDKVLGLLGLPEGDGDAISAVSHGTTVATNQLLEGKVDAARASSPPRATRRCSRSPASRCPTATATPTSGSSPTGSCPRDLVKGVGGRLDFTGAEVRPFDEDGARAVARWFRDAGHRHARRLLPARLRQPRARGADARRARRGAPRRGRVAVAARCCASTASTSAR